MGSNGLPLHYWNCISLLIIDEGNFSGQGLMRFIYLYSVLMGSQFVPEGDNCHSSSITDLFDSLKSAVTFFLGLEWPDKVQHAKFLTELSKVTLNTR